MAEKNLQPNNVATSKSFNFDKISGYVLLALVFLLPLFFIPKSISLGVFDKSALILFGTFVLVVVWVVGRLKDGKLAIQKSLIAGASTLLIVTLGISAISSPEKDLSFFGFGYESSTFMFVFFMIILMFLTSYLLDNKGKINKLFFVLLVSSGVLFLLQLINLFKNLSFANLASSDSSLLGSWNNLAVFFGLMAIILCIKISEETKLKSKTYLTVVFILSLLALCVVNFTLIWVILLSLSALYAIFRLVKERATIASPLSITDKKYGFALKVSRVITWPVLILFIISLLFVILGRDGEIGTKGGPLNRVSESIVESPFEVRPSFSGTLLVFKNSLTEDPLAGPGLNRFNTLWQEHKPDAILQNPYFWNTEFSFGHGYLTTFLSTSGIVGLIGLVLFMFAILFIVLKGIIRGFSSDSTEGQISLILTSLSVLYLWVLMILYVPSPAIIALTFIITGAHLAMLKNSQMIKSFDFSRIKPQIYGFGSVLALVIFVIITIAASFSYTQKAMAWNNFSDGIRKVIAGDIIGGHEDLADATRLDKRDLYYRIKSEAGLMSLTNIVNQEGKTQEELRIEFEQASGVAFSDAVTAIELNPYYYANYIGLAKVYTNLIPYGVKDADKAAFSTYDKAAEIAPKNPIIPYEKALLYFGLDMDEEGIASLEKALSLKSNYTDALFLRSQLAIRDGKLEEALTDTYQAVSINPTNTGLLFQLGFLQYRADDYDNALITLARAVELNPSYSNARYFLGLSLDKLGRKDEAIAQFEVVLQLNPGHEGVIDILENLRAGRSPFEGVRTEDLPEEQEEAPIDEDN